MSLTARRVGVPKAELSLIRRFLRSLKERPWKMSPTRVAVTLREVEGGQGCPDIVIAGLDRAQATVGKSVTKLLSLPSVAELISRLREWEGIVPDELRRITGLSIRVVQERLQELKQKGIVKETRSGRFRLTPGFKIPSVEIWAFEAKTHDWKKALYQALQYKGFAQQSLVVMPGDRAALLRRNAEPFRTFGVGVLVVEEDGEVRCLVAPERSIPRSAALHLKLVGRILSSRKSELLHANGGPESR